MGRHKILSERLGNNLERTRAGGGNIELAEMYVKQIGEAIAWVGAENKKNGIEDWKVRASDWSNIDEVAFDQGIDKVRIICRRGQRQQRHVSAERGEHLTLVAGISAGHSVWDQEAEVWEQCGGRYGMLSRY